MRRPWIFHVIFVDASLFNRMVDIIYCFVIWFAIWLILLCLSEAVFIQWVMDEVADTFCCSCKIWCNDQRVLMIFWFVGPVDIYTDDAFNTSEDLDNACSVIDFSFHHVWPRYLLFCLMVWTHWQALLSAIGVGEKSATVIGATFQVSFLIEQY